MDRDERTLWAAWRRRRDERAFERLVKPHLPFLLDLARRLGCSQSDADDVAQQALCDLAAERRSRPVRVGVKPWLGRRISLLSRSLHRDAARRRAREAAAAREGGGRTAMPSAPADVSDARDQVEAALSRLAAAEREVLVLRFLHDLEYAEVAYVLEATPAACRLRVHRALARLRREFGRAAPAALAALVLLRGARPAAALVSGALAVTATTVKTSLILAALVLCTALLIPATGLLRADDPAPRPAGQRPVAELPEAPPAPVRTRQPAKEPANREEAKPPDPPRANPLAEYAAARRDGETWQRLGSLRLRLAGMQKQLGIDPGDKPRAEDADPATKRYLLALREAYERAQPGFVRRDLLSVLLTTHARYLKQTGDAALVAPLARLADSSRDPREKAAIVGAIAALDHPRSAQERARFLRHSDPVVRAAVAPLLDAEPMARLVRDPDPRVRRNAALGLQYYIDDPAYAETLLEGLSVEQDPLAMDARVRAVRALDPTDGEARIERALREAPEAVAKLAAGVTLPAVQPAARELYEDPVTKRYLAALWTAWSGLPSGKARQRTLDNFTTAHRGYVWRTGDRSLVEKLSAAVEANESRKERQTIVGSFAGASDEASVDLLVTWAKSRHEDVRANTGRALAMVRGEHAPRARKALHGLFRDESVSVRRQSAIFAGLSKSDDAVPKLLDALAVETDFSAAYSQATGIVKLDPRQGRARIEELHTTVPEQQRGLIGRILSALR